MTQESRDRYRQLFSVVFADFFLFEDLDGIETPDLDDRAARYLERLHLENKVQVRDGQLSTTALSQGQRKRLALLSAYLEDRPLYLFDEWAADQDPSFKETFYRRLLPELRAAGKTVIVVSHDDRYYDTADRIVKLENGQIVFDRAAEDAVRTDAIRAVSLAGGDGGDRRALQAAEIKTLRPKGRVEG